MNVLVSIPNTGWIHKHVCFVTDRIVADRRYQTKLIRPTHNPYENNLHHIVLQFIEEGFDFWLNIDSDNPPINNPLDLVEYDLDIIGLPTPVWHSEKSGDRPVYWNGYDVDEDSDSYREHPLRDGLQRVDAIGSGCMLISRRVFEDEEMQKAPFARQCYDDGRVYKGTDISFCERARDRGFEIWCHYDYPCRHFHELEINEVVTAFRGLYE